MDRSSEDCETLLAVSDCDTEGFENEKRPYARSRRTSWNIWIPLISAFLAGLIGFAVGSYGLIRPANYCVAYASNYSPIMKEVDMSLRTQRFNGSLMKENIYRQKGSPEVDAAWAALGVEYHSVLIPASEAAQSGLAPDQVKINSKYGGGYPANVEGLHHLHCLNLVRQSLYYNYEYYHAKGEGAFKNDDHVVHMHVSHCLDIVRQQLMCTTDIGVLGQVWWNTESPQPFVDFNTEHKCRNFEGVRKWAEERQLPMDTPNDYLEPPKTGDRIYAEIP